MNENVDMGGDENMITIVQPKDDKIVLPINSFKNIPESDYKPREIKIKPIQKNLDKFSDELVFPINKKNFNIHDLIKQTEASIKINNIKKSPIKNENSISELLDKDRTKNNKIEAKRDEIFKIITNNSGTKKNRIIDKSTDIIFNSNDREMYLESVKKNLENYNIKKKENLKNRKDLFSSFDEKIEQLKKKNKDIDNI
jgi:hypothetical protein